MQVKSASVPSVGDVLSSPKPTAGDVKPSADPGAVAVSLSKTASLISQASALAEADPSKFKSMMQLVSDDLQAAAGQGGGPGYGQMAARFAAAAQSGKPSDLFSPEPHANQSVRPSRVGATSAAATAAEGGARAQGVFGVAANMLEKALSAASATASSSRGRSST